jgi:hypothetical protein
MKCKYDRICQYCGESHGETPCTSKSLICSNCKGQHAATDQYCPSREKEAQILKFKADNHIPITEARRRFKIIKTDKRSFSEVTNSTVIAHNDSNNKKEITELMQGYLAQTQQIVSEAFKQQTDFFLKVLEQFQLEFKNTLQAVVQSLTTHTVSQFPNVQNNPPKKKKKSHPPRDGSLVDSSNAAESALGVGFAATDGSFPQMGAP